MNKLPLGFVQTGAALVLVVAMLALALGSATSGLLLGDAVLVLALTTGLWLLLHGHATAPRATLRRVAQPARVRSSTRRTR